MLAVGAAVAPGTWAAPANDDFANATNLVGDDPYAIAEMGTATAEPNENLPAGAGYSRTVWYRWTPATTHLVLLNATTTLPGTSPRSGARNTAIYTGTDLADSQVEDEAADGTFTYAYDLQFIAPGITPPGDYTGSLTMTAIAQP